MTRFLHIGGRVIFVLATIQFPISILLGALGLAAANLATMGLIYASELIAKRWGPPC